eukprot:14847869-Alexandrium_andersonii.AAC.1
MGGGDFLPDAATVSSIPPGEWEEMITDAKLQQAPQEGEGEPTEVSLNTFQKARFRRFRQACRIVA